MYIPQMSPLMWLFIYFYFLLLLIFVMMLIYYLLNFKNINLLKFNMKNLNYKFLW